MNIYGIIAVIEGFDLESSVQNAHLDALSYVTVVGETFGVMTIDASVQGSTAAEAVRQLTQDLDAINVTMVRIDPDLVSTSEIARRLNVSRETVRLWSLGRRRADFPAPYGDIGDSQIWRWAHVWEWAVHQRLTSADDEMPLPVDCVDVVNGDLARGRLSGDAMRQGAVFA